MLNGLNGHEWYECCEWRALSPFFWIKKPQNMEAEHDIIPIMRQPEVVDQLYYHINMEYME